MNFNENFKNILRYLICIIMNINENLKNEVKCKKKQLKLPLLQFDQPFHPVILYENFLIHIVMIINKTSKIAYWLSSKRDNRGSILTWGAMFCP